MRCLTLLGVLAGISAPLHAQYYNPSGVVLPPWPENTVITSAFVRIKAEPDETLTSPDNTTELYKDTRSVDRSTGAFGFSRIREGQYELIAVHDADVYMPGCKRIKVPGEINNLTLELQRPTMHPVEWQLKLNGKPVPRAKVRLFPQCFDWESKDKYASTGVTNEDGWVSLPNLRLAPDLQFRGEADVESPTSGNASVLRPVRYIVPAYGRVMWFATHPHPQQTASSNNAMGNNTLTFEGVFQKSSSGPFQPRTDTVEPKVWEIDVKGRTLLPQGLTAAEKLKLHLTRTVDPSAFVFSAIVGVVNQLRDEPFEWGGGAAGFGRRFASAYGYYSAVRNALSLGLDAPLHLDPRYFQSRRSGAWPRLQDCLVQTVLTRTDGGRRTFNFWRFGSAYAAGFVSNAWVPDRISTPRRAIIRGSLSIGLDTASNAAKEFLPDLRKKLHKKRYQ